LPFYDNLNKACKDKGTSVSAVLIELGLGKSNGTYWKNGSFPSSDIVIQLAERLGVSSDYLLDIKKSPAPEGAGEEWSPERMALEQTIASLSVDELRRVEEFAAFVRSQRSVPLQ